MDEFDLTLARQPYEPPPGPPKQPMWLQVLRWILFLPVAFVVGMLTVRICSAIPAWINFLSSREGALGPALTFFFTYLVSQGLGGAAFTYAGCAVAPRGRFVVGWVLCGYIVAMNGISVCFAAQHQEWVLVAQNAATVIGAFWGFGMFRQHHEGWAP